VAPFWTVFNWYEGFVKNWIFKKTSGSAKSTSVQGADARIHPGPPDFQPIFYEEAS
jgi:hypothetical protein